MLDLTSGLNFAAVGGLTLGADPVATAMMHAAAEQGRPLNAFIVRKEGKAHGLQRRIEGPDVAGLPVLAVEDTSTTGNSVLSAVDALTDGGRRSRGRGGRRRPRRAAAGRGAWPAVSGRLRPRGPRSRLTRARTSYCLAGLRREILGTHTRAEGASRMPIATPEIYAQMLDRAKEHGFAYPAINVTSSQTLNAALRGFADAGSDGIVQVSTGGAEYLSGSLKDMVTGAVALAEYANVVAAKYPVHVALHTDHCPKDKLDGYMRPLIQSPRSAWPAASSRCSSRTCGTGRRCRWTRT